MSGVPSVGRRMAAGAVWMVLARLFVRAIGLVSTMILARLLVPADFGLVALATTVVAVLDTVGDFSFDLALIRDQKSTRVHYDTVWTLTIARSAMVAVLLVGLALPAADFFNDARLVDLFYVLAVVQFADGFRNVGVVDFRKNLQFDREFRFLLYTKIFQFVVTVGLALLWRNYWALIAGIAAQKIGMLALSYLMHPYRPRLSLGGWNDIIGFSKWLLFSNLLNFVSTRADVFVLGRITDTATVGAYTVAYEIAELPTTELVSPIARAVYPGYAKTADDAEVMRQSYLSVLALFLLIAMPAALGIGLVADPLVRLFLGDNWLAAIPLIEVLILYGVLTMTTGNATAVFMVMGRPQWVTYFTGLGLCLKLPALIWGAMTAGALGAAWALVATRSVMVVLFIVTILLFLRLSPLRFVAAVWRSAAAAAAMIAAVRAADAAWFVDGMSPAVQLFSLVAIGAVTYVASVAALWLVSGRPAGAERLMIDFAAERLSRLPVWRLARR